MTSLLGPLLHISAAVPAIAVAGIMGIATLDTFNWRGRGSTLLLDWVAHQLGIPITGYTLSAWEALRQGQSGAAGVSFDTAELAANLAKGTLSAQQVDRYCTVWMAGIAAETLTYGTAEGGEDDRQQLYTLWASFNRSATEASLKERLATLQAKTLLQANQPAYDALVAVMERKAPLSECYEALGELSGV